MTISFKTDPMWQQQVRDLPVTKELILLFVLLLSTKRKEVKNFTLSH